ncbi:MAG: ASKHA domain-containing protein [Saccharofermentanales bacterium]|nr:DUF4445 domain-containing protein [Clostridiaceae bacterium]
MRLIIVDNQTEKEQEFYPGDHLLDVLLQSSSGIHTPCGGRGTCGKCRVEILGIGHVLACQTILSTELIDRAARPLTVILPGTVRAQISTEGMLPDISLRPSVYKGMAVLAEPTIDDQRPDDERFEAATGLTIPFGLLPNLPLVLRRTDFQPSYYGLISQNGKPGRVLRFISADAPNPLGLAVDIGTTTLAAYLYDLETGQRLAADSALNPQSGYGADVISRIDRATESAEQREALRASIGRAIVDLAKNLLRDGAVGIGKSLVLDDIVHYVLTGNTTMLHLLAGLPPEAIARAPFIPVSRRLQTLTAAELGLPVAPDALCQLLPSIASYVGADITAGILACGLLDQKPETGSLLIDIGTNGELVAVGPHGAVACSTAAGPAFEGANIRCGIGGVQGAIDAVRWDGKILSYTLIGGLGHGADRQLARGICGSGLVAAVASLLDCGLIESTGRITDQSDQLPSELQERIITISGQPAIVLAPAAASANGEPIVLTQKDIRELQNAKAAIAAGITLLMSKAGLAAENVGQVHIAGGFGNYLDVQHAFRIGLLPEELRNRTRTVGNTAGMGAVLCLLNTERMEQARAVVDQVDYFELSGEKEFTELYVNAMMFPENE